MPNYNQTIKQVLAIPDSPNVNGVRVSAKLSEALLECMFQGVVEKNGKGVNNKYVTEAEANENAQIFVNRVKAHLQKGREHGSSKNGGAFAQNGHMSATETVGIEILQYFDEVILVPRCTTDRMNVDLVATEVANYVKSINLAINGSSWAAKWLSTYSAKAEDRNVVEISATDISNKAVLGKIIDSNTLLDAGDEAHDIDAFDLDSRIMTFQVSYRSTLFAAGVLALGGANFGYDIARKGTLDSESASRSVDDGYWGVIDGVEAHGISNLSLKYAAWFCGMPDEEFIKGTYLKGWNSSSYANARGVSTIEQVTTIPSHGGQGVEIQPFTKLGAVAWYPKGNVAFVSDDSYDPIKDLKALFSGVASEISFKLKSAGSRCYPVATIGTIGASAFTCTASAEDDAGVDHLKGGYFVVTDAPITRVAEFLASANDASVTYKGSFTSGTSKSTTIGSGKYVTCLLIADDGSCTLVSKVYTA